MPRSLLEAAASARPVITTNAVGCRDTVDAAVSGFLCAPRNGADLARQMQVLLQMTPEQRSRMGQVGRLKMEREFDERIVIDAYRHRIGELSLAGQGACAAHNNSASQAATMCPTPYASTADTGIRDAGTTN